MFSSEFSSFHWRSQETWNAFQWAIGYFYGLKKKQNVMLSESELFDSIGNARMQVTWWIAFLLTSHGVLICCAFSLSPSSLSFSSSTTLHPCICLFCPSGTELNKNKVQIMFHSSSLSSFLFALFIEMFRFCWDSDKCVSKWKYEFLMNLFNLFN